MTQFTIGGRYNWKSQPERLIYLGDNFSGNGYWHQFAKVEEPEKVWCEVKGCDLESFEESEPTYEGLEKRIIKIISEMTEIERWNATIDNKKTMKKLRFGGTTTGRLPS